jgi:hypothetical protein
MGFQAGKKMEKKVVVQVGDDEIGGRDGVTQDVLDTKTDAGAESVQFQVSLRLLYGKGIAVPSLDFRPHPGGGEGKDTGAAAEIQDPAGFQAGGLLAHELDEVAEAEPGGGVFPGAEGGSGPDLETGDTPEDFREEAGVAGDDEVVADAEMERGGLALVEPPDAALEPGLEFAQGQNFG